MQSSLFVIMQRKLKFRWHVHIVRGNGEGVRGKEVGKGKRDKAVCPVKCKLMGSNFTELECFLPDLDSFTLSFRLHTMYRDKCRQSVRKV